MGLFPPVIQKRSINSSAERRNQKLRRQSITLIIDDIFTHTHICVYFLWNISRGVCPLNLHYFSTPPGGDNCVSKRHFAGH